MKFEIDKINDLAYLKQLQKKFGKTYYFATKLLPKAIQNETFLLYAFFRIPDEIVDNSFYYNISPENFLENWKKEWQMAEKQDSQYLILNEISTIFSKYNIPFQYGESFIEAMIIDLVKKEYENYEELRKYMYGSAGCVGLIMTYLFGFQKQDTLEYAEEMGYAMQMTNFIRDIKEDIDQRKRIYIPKEIYQKFNLTDLDFINHNFNENFKNLIKDQIIFTKQLYKKSFKGIADLKSGQIQTFLAGFLYLKILDKIERQNFNVFIKRAKVSLLEKIFYTVKILWKWKLKKEVPWE